MKIDGIAGSKTIKQIIGFQKHKMNMRTPDGRVDPNGRTIQALNKVMGNSPNSSEKSQTAVSGQWSGDSSQWTQEKKLMSLNSDFRKKVKTVMDNLKNKGFKPKIVYGWRSIEVQKRLKKLGRSKINFSFHNAQLPKGTPNSYAADLIDSRWGYSDEAQKNNFWAALGKEAKAVGLIWGGDWKKFKDVAHIQGKQNHELATVKKASGL